MSEILTAEQIRDMHQQAVDNPDAYDWIGSNGTRDLCAAYLALLAERDALREEMAKWIARVSAVRGYESGPSASLDQVDADNFYISEELHQTKRELAEARAEIARLTQASQWQPIDRMPQYKRVLFTYQIGVGNWAEPCIIDWSVAYRHGYWMPLPAPPANGESR